MEVDRSTALHAAHGDETFYFCSERCRRAFRARIAEEEVDDTRGVFRGILRALASVGASDITPKTAALFALLLALMLAINGLNVVNSYVGRDFITALERKDMPEFMWQSGLYLLVFVCSSVAAVFYRFAEETLGLLWRESQTRGWLERYLTGNVYHRLSTAGDLENPDQRIAEDVRAFTTTTLSFALMSLNATFTIVAFSGVLWTISPLLFGVALAYASAGSLVTYLLGRRLIGLNSAQLDREADFRSELISLRENAESVAILGWERRLRERLLLRLANLVSNAKHIVSVNRNVNCFTTFYNYLVPVLPIFVVAHLFMRGEVEFGVVTQSAMAFAQLMGAFSLIVTQFQSISSYAAVMARLRRLSSAMEAAVRNPLSSIAIHDSDDQLAFEHLTLRSASERILIADLSITIPFDVRLMITTVDDAARSALVKALAGAWSWGEGAILRPTADRMLLMTEPPYLPKGTLRELLVRPDQRHVVEDARIVAALSALSVEAVIPNAGGLDMEQDWGETLSLNERTLLAVARAVLTQPKLVVLDRLGVFRAAATTTRVIQTLSEAGIGCVVLGSPGDDTAPFDAVLRIEPDGTWEHETSRAV